MKLLVTGGCGFIGTNFIRHVLACPDVECVVNLDLLTYAGNRENLSDLESDRRYRLVVGDIGDRSLVARLLVEHRVTTVVNFAAESHVDRSIDDPGAFVRTNVNGTFHLLEAALAHWKQMESAARDRFRFLHVSTDEVFGSLLPGEPPFTETTAYAPNSPYSASKASSDHFVRAYHHTYGLPVLTTNCSNNYGPYQFPEKLIPLVTLNALERKPLPIYGDGGNVRDWLYVDDHCRAIDLVLRGGSVGETYNVGGLNEMTNLQVVKTICAVLDELAPTPGRPSYDSLITFVRDRPGHDRRYAIDCSKIQRQLGWQPSENFQTGIRKTVQWYLNNASWCAALSQRRRIGLDSGRA